MGNLSSIVMSKKQFSAALLKYGFESWVPEGIHVHKCDDDITIHLSIYMGGDSIIRKINRNKYEVGKLLFKFLARVKNYDGKS